MAGIRSRSSTSHRRAFIASSFRFPHPTTQRPESSMSLPDRMISTRKTEFISKAQPIIRPKIHSRAKSVPCLSLSGHVSYHGDTCKELLDYSTITLQDTQEDVHMRDVVLSNFKVGRSVDRKNEEFYEAIIRSQSCSETEKERLHRSLCRQKESQRIESAKLNDPRRPGYKRINCPRLLHFEETAQMSKQFCDVLGTKACKDCARVGERLASVNDYGTVFPDISVSTFQLCSNDANMKRTLKNFQSCDAWERYRGQSSWPAHRPYMYGHETRPAPSRCSSPVSRAGSIRLDLNFDRLTKIEDAQRLEKKNTEESEHDSDLEGEVDIPISSSPSPPPRAHRSSLQNSDYFSRKYRPNASRTETPESLRAMTPVHAEIEADKRRIMEYVWRLLAPKPPQMDVRDMNVSVYTPKAIPGIKIVEDGEQSTIIVQRPPEIRDHMW